MRKLLPPHLIETAADAIELAWLSHAFDLRMERRPDGAFTCVEARWRRDGAYIEGTCTVTVSKWANDDGVGFDEGTFEARFPKERVEISKGTFRTRRN